MNEAQRNVIRARATLITDCLLILAVCALTFQVVELARPTWIDDLRRGYTSGQMTRAELAQVGIMTRKVGFDTHD